jgi:hypothetical protein
MQQTLYSGILGSQRDWAELLFVSSNNGAGAAASMAVAAADAADAAEAAEAAEAKLQMQHRT